MVPRACRSMAEDRKWGDPERMVSWKPVTAERGGVQGLASTLGFGHG